MGVYKDLLEKVNRKPGDVWKTDKGGFRGMNRSGNMQTFSDPDKAKAYVATKDTPTDEPKKDKKVSDKENPKRTIGGKDKTLSKVDTSIILSIDSDVKWPTLPSIHFSFSII